MYATLNKRRFAYGLNCNDNYFVHSNVGGRENTHKDKRIICKSPLMKYGLQNTRYLCIHLFYIMMQDIFYTGINICFPLSYVKRIIDRARLELISFSNFC